MHGKQREPYRVDSRQPRRRCPAAATLPCPRCGEPAADGSHCQQSALRLARRQRWRFYSLPGTPGSHPLHPTRLQPGKRMCVCGGGAGCGWARGEGKKRVENRWRKEGNDMIAIKWNEKANGLDGIFSYSARLYDHIFLGYGSIRRLSSSLIRQSNAKCNFI